MKLIVTGKDAAGTSVFVEEKEPRPVVGAAFPGLKNTPLWECGTLPEVPHDGHRDRLDAFFPPPGGHRFFLLTIDPPDPAATAEPTPEQVAEYQSLFPGLLEAMELDDPGMHTSDTVDCIVVISGQLVLELDHGAERTLGPGDFIVQHGTRHRWRNEGSGPATFAAFMIGARPAS